MSPFNAPFSSWRKTKNAAIPMPNTATLTEMIAFGTSKSACTSSGNATVGSTHSLNFSIPSGAALMRPANTEKIARMMSGTVMSGSDSCGCPWPRYSPKNVR